MIYSARFKLARYILRELSDIRSGIMVFCRRMYVLSFHLRTDDTHIAEEGSE
jgi:hypothetical protein